MFDQGRWRLWFDYFHPGTFVSLGYAENDGDFTNPEDWKVVRAGKNPLLKDWPNPEVVKAGNMYYAFCDAPYYPDSLGGDTRQLTMARSKDGLDWEILGHIRPEGLASSHVPQALVLPEDGKTMLYLFYAWKPPRQEGKPWDFRYKKIRYIKRELTPQELGEYPPTCIHQGVFFAMKFCVLLKILLPILALLNTASSARALELTAQGSSQADASLGAANAIDGDTGTFWSSAVHASASATEWIQIDLDETIALDGVTLTPRMAGATVYAFPVNYSFEYSYDEAGSRWFSIPGASYSNVATPTGAVTHSFTGKILACRIRITATKLSVDDSATNYYFQLAEVAPIRGDTVFPFATSQGAGLDNQLNMMWAIYGAINDGSAAVYEFGNEPGYHEWMALKYGWSQSTADKLQTLATGRLVPWAQSSDGYMWSWSDQEKWPTGDGSYHNENNAKYILACWRYWCWSRNSTFFYAADSSTVSANPRADVSGGRTMRQKLREAMRYLEESLQGDQGGIVIEDNGMDNDGTVTGTPTNYWDNWRMGYKNPYDNIYYYAALEAMAQLEEYWGNPTRATQLRTYRQGCKQSYDTNFWNSEKGRYVSTIDKNGTVWDFGSTFINLEALAYGLGDSAKAGEIFSWLDGSRTIAGETSQGADIYYWTFAPRANTLAIESTGSPYWWESLGGAINVTGNARWQTHLENGGAIFYTSFYDIMARIKYLGADNAWARLSAIVDEFEIDQLRRDPGGWAVGIIGEFPESGLVPCAVTYGFAGLEADLEGLHVRPNLPSALEWIRVNSVAYAGATLDIEVWAQWCIITSAQDSSRALYVGSNVIEPGQTAQITFPPPKSWPSV